MNIKDIAKLSGVSVATVSRVINNQPNVRPEKRELVLSVMADHGYTPNIFARGLNSKSTKSIGILCSELDDINHAKSSLYWKNSCANTASVLFSAVPESIAPTSGSILNF